MHFLKWEILVSKKPKDAQSSTEQFFFTHSDQRFGHLFAVFTPKFENLFLKRGKTRMLLLGFGFWGPSDRK